VKASNRCGAAYLFRRNDQGWELAVSIARPVDAGESAAFGQSVLLLADGTAIVGGTGLIGGPGVLHVFVPHGSGLDLVQTLLPEGGTDSFYATDLSASADGSWLAVGGAQSVALYRRRDAGFEPVKLLEAPDSAAGYFGEAVALDGNGRTLLVGAPRTGCSPNVAPRCGSAYRYLRGGRVWRLAGTVAPVEARADANFGHEVALDAAGKVTAIEGHGVTVEQR
jgi:hypothetical protein